VILVGGGLSNPLETVISRVNCSRTGSSTIRQVIAGPFDGTMSSNAGRYEDAAALDKEIR
ncbi:unnamed protein product, partial [Chrysoparadoxa australica]